VVNVPGFRGPRTATMMAIGSAGIQLDDRNAKLMFPFADRTGWFRPQMGTKGGYGKGVLASVKSDGKTVHLTFVQKMVKQTQCAQTRETNHITRIDSNGTVRYQVVCVRSETVVVNKASDPQSVDARYAAGRVRVDARRYRPGGVGERRRGDAVGRARRRGEVAGVERESVSAGRRMR
jgi:hypothetical protein